MNAISRFFLQGKHWQIFIPVIGVYLAGNIIGIFPMPFPSRPGSIIAKESLAFGLLIGLSSLGLYFWFWTMGSFFTSILKPELRPRLSLFQVALIYLPLYIAFFITTFPDFTPGIIGLILLLHLIAMFFAVYTIYFVSKSLVMAEAKEAVSFSDYAGECFLLCFFPVGIWIIQPRVNQLFANRNIGERSSAPANS